MVDKPLSDTLPPRKSPSKALIGYIDLDYLGESHGHIPTLDDFKEAWGELTAVGKQTVTAMLKGETFRGYMAELKQYGIHTTGNARQRMGSRTVLRAFYYGLIAKLSTDEAKLKMVKKVIASTSLAEVTRQQVETMVMTDKDHLNELAEQLRVDGDGKREILRELIAYGMQAKQVEAAIIQNGKTTTPAIFGLADPKVAYSAVQELNRMDHEYGEDDKATSSIEGQAARVRRLANKMNKISESQAKSLKGISKKITMDELKRYEAADHG